MFSVRIVDADFYVTKPVAGQDVLYSEFRESNITRVPVLRIFGSTPSGQKTCLHVHQVFPYIYVPYDGTQPSKKYLKQFATSVDFAVQVALGKASSSTHHVYQASIVKRIPFYGYHEEEQDFIKIQFYNPRIIARVVELLQNGAILNKVFQPYESHIPYILQFLMDFNLYGMNLLHTGMVMFRGWPVSGGSTSQPSPYSGSSSPFSANISGSSHVSATVYQHWSEKTIPSNLRLDIPKTSRCELEVDVISTDIFNQLEIGTSIGTNPGIVAMWEDEKERRRQQDQSSQITLPISQDRGDLPILDTEKDFKARISEIIAERNQLIQSQLDKMEKSQVDSLSPEDFQELSQSILLDGKETQCSVVLSEDVDENEPIVNETIIEDVLEASQSQSGRISGLFDSDLIDILLSLSDDPNETVSQECSPKSGTSEVSVAKDIEVVDESENEDEDEDEESFVMSQPVWQDDGLSGEPFSARIPQLDGCHDDKDDNHCEEAGSTCDKRVFESTSVPHEDEELEDFKRKKTRKSARTKQVKGGIQNKANLTTRQRKSVVAPLAVSGGNSKARKTSKRTTSVSEATTRKAEGGYDKNVLKSTRLGDETSNRGSKDLVLLSSRSVTERHPIGVGREISSKETLHSEAGVPSCGAISSESQTSDFELHLSDSSSDNSDFKNPAKIPRIPSLGNEQTASSLTVVGIEDGCLDKEVSSIPRNDKARRAVDSGKPLDDAHKCSKPRGRRRTRRVRCLEFTKDIMPETKGTLPLKHERTSRSSRKTGISRKSSRGPHGRKRKQSGKDDVEIILGCPEEGKTIKKYGQRKLAKNAVLMDACVMLERLSIEKRKCANEAVRNEFEKLEMCPIEKGKSVGKVVQKDFEKHERIPIEKGKIEGAAVRDENEKLEICPMEKGKCVDKVIQKYFENSERISIRNEKPENVLVRKDSEDLKKISVEKWEDEIVPEDFEKLEKFPLENEKSKTEIPRKDFENLKMLSTNNVKSENIAVLKDSVKYGSFSSPSERLHELGYSSSELLGVDEESDMFPNALYHMAVLSPSSNYCEDDSPPLPSSPSLNTSFSDSLDNLIKCEAKDVEVKDELCNCSFGSTPEDVEFDFGNHSESGQSEKQDEGDVSVKPSLVSDIFQNKYESGSTLEDVEFGDHSKSRRSDKQELHVEGDVSVKPSLVSDIFQNKPEELGVRRRDGIQVGVGQDGNALNLGDNEGGIEMYAEAVQCDEVPSSETSRVDDSFSFHDVKCLEMDTGADMKELKEKRNFIFEKGGSEEPDTCANNTELSQESCVKSKIWKPLKDPPSPSYVLKTKDLYGLPHERHQKAFCSNPNDVPLTRTVGGRRLHLSSLSVDKLSEFDLGGNFQTLSKIRRFMGDQADSSFVKECLRTLVTDGGRADDRGYLGDPAQMKLALMGEDNVVITPARFPPSQDFVRRWMQEECWSAPVEKNYASSASETRKKPNASLEQDEGCHDTREYPITPKQGNFESHACRTIDKDIDRKVPCMFQTPQPEDRLLRGMTNLGQEGIRGINHVTQDKPFGVSPGPQHSTPLGKSTPLGNQGRSRELFLCTPVESGSSVKPNSGCSHQEVPISFVGDDQCTSRISNLRRNLLTSQTKKENSVHEYPRSSVDASYIEGPTPTNSCDFKISQPNIQDAKTLHEVQYLTILSIELHIRTRKTLRPDPEFDAICAIFYNIEHDTKEGKKNVTGVLVASNESTKLSRTTTESTSRDHETQASTSRDADGVANRDNADTKGTSVGGTSRCWSKENILRRTGFAGDFEIITVDEESEAITRFVQLVHHWDPDIFVGYEVQMLSWGYLLQRSTTLGIDLASQLSRLLDSSGTTRFDAEKDKWGASHTSEITIAGRIVLNVWRLMRHEVTLNIYSFENIAYHVLHERIPLYTFQQLSRWWDQKLPHNRWRTAEHYITRCQANIKILNHSDLVNRTSEFARLYGILFYSVVSRGSQFRVESMMLRLAKPMNYVAVSPSVQQRARMCAPECIALVMEPQSRFYTDPVVVLDFQSLYPSMIIAYNYCYSTCLGRVSRLNELGSFEFGCTSLNVPPGLLEKHENDIHVSANGAAFVKSNVRRGVLPRMLEEILNTRVMVKKAMKEYKKDKALGKLLDARQLGLKLIANVTYGYTSANFSGRMPCVEIADAIVRKARETLERAVHLVNTREEWGGRVVYGDTDSLFVLLKGATKEEAFKIGHDIVEAVTASNPKPVKLKFEKVYLPCVLQTKKRYVGYMYETLDQKEAVFDAKGIETVRRDNCPAVGKILEKSLRVLFEAKDVSLVKRFVQRQFRKLMEERVSLQDFIFAKEYRGMRNYKPTACVPALALAKRRLSRDRRAEPRVGERVPYVVVYGTPGLPLIQLVRSPEEVLNDPGLRLNATYYINKQIIPPLNRAFGLIGIDVATWYTELPRFTPRQQVTAGKQKSTISRYFTTLHCPVCEELTHQGLCHGCRKNARKAVTILADRIRKCERKYDHLTQICFQCCGTRDPEMFCITLDCPVRFKMIKTARDVNYAETLRDVQRKIEIANS